MKLAGYSWTTRAIRSLLTRAHRVLTASSPKWCSIAEARGEKIVASMPRSVISFSWLPSTDARMSSSDMSGYGGGVTLAAKAAFCACRQAV